MSVNSALITPKSSEIKQYFYFIILYSQIFWIRILGRFSGFTGFWTGIAERSCLCPIVQNLTWEDSKARSDSWRVESSGTFTHESGG